MQFYSTRNREHIASFAEAVLQGLAPDGGLFHPTEHPDLRDVIAACEPDIEFSDLAARLLVRLFPDFFDEERASAMCKRAFPFSPVVSSLNTNISLLELFHGPSCAFKDFGASFLATVMEALLAESEEHATILTATSGDTGSAVIQAFLDKKNITVVVLYPSKRISHAQEQQLATHSGNIIAVEVDGSFDDCQRLVKEAFNHEELRREFNLTSANSINIGRLIPQAFYYIYADTRLSTEERRRRVFCVPSGNFGNLTAGLLAWSWGMESPYFLAASNANSVVPEYLENGNFTPRASLHTHANAMDVGNPSNFERLQALSEQRQSAMNSFLQGSVVFDDAIETTIKNYHDTYGVFLCPHTAVAVCASERLLHRAWSGNEELCINGELPHMVALATADPGKFAEIIQQSSGESPPIPERIAKLLSREKRSIPSEARRESLQKILRDHVSTQK